MKSGWLLVQITAAFTVGVALAHLYATNWHWVGASAWLLAAICCSLLLLFSKRWRVVRVQKVLLLLCLVCLGGWATDLQYEHWLAGAEWLQEAQEVELWGVLQYSAGRMVIQPQRICQAGRPEVCFEGKLLLGLSWAQSSRTELSTPEAPMPIWVRGEYEMPERARNPGAFDPLQDALSKQHYGRLWVSDWERQPGNIALLDRVRYRWQSLIMQALPGDTGALVTGIVLGGTGQLSERDRLAIQQAGISHVTSVSGLHVSIIAGFLWFVLGNQHGARAWLGILAVGVFVLLVGSGAPAVRAFLGLLLVIISRAIGRSSNPWLSLASAWLILLLVNPALWAGVGFRLSFASTAGILALAKPLLHSSSKGTRLLTRGVRYLQNMIVLSLGAQLGSAYFAIQTFNTWPIWGLVANLVGVPLTFLILVGGLLASVLCGIAQGIAELLPLFSALLSWMGGTLFTGVGWCATTFLVLCRTIAQLPWVVVELPSMPLAVGWCYYAGLVALAFYLQSRRLPKVLGRLAGYQAWRWVLVAGLLLILAICCSFPQIWQLRITFFDVGEGDAILIEVPGVTAVLVDAGPRTMTWDASKTIIPQLRKRGIRRIHLIVNTHPHADHLGGMAGVIHSRPVLMAMDAGTEATSQTYQDYILALEQQQVSVMQATAGEHITLGNVRFEVLWPPAPVYDGAYRGNVNDQSVILRIVYGQVAVLLMGDASHRVQENLLQDGELSSVVLWKVPHQGALDALNPLFLQQIAPSVSVVSVGANSYGHPHADVVRALQEQGMLCRTDTDGAVEFITNGLQWRVRSALGKSCQATGEL